MVEHNCIICNKLFEAVRTTHLTCSKNCSRKSDYQKHKEAYKSRAKLSNPKAKAKLKEANKSKWFGKCLVCGIDYKKLSQSQKYCSLICQKKILNIKYNLNGLNSKWSNKTYMNNRVEHIKKGTIYQVKRYKIDPLYNMIRRLRSRTSAIFKAKYWDKEIKTLDLLGCTTFTLKQHLENQFKDNMTWENRGEWHIDHIIPLSSAKNEDELFKLCNYKNLQPLWAKDNLIKGNR